MPVRRHHGGKPCACSPTCSPDSSRSARCMSSMPAAAPTRSARACPAPASPPACTTRRCTPASPSTPSSPRAKPTWTAPSPSRRGRISAPSWTCSRSTAAASAATPRSAAAPLVARGPALAPGQRHRRRRPQRPHPLRRAVRDLPPVSRRKPQLLLRLLRASRDRHAGAGAAGQAAPHRRQAGARAGHDGGRDRLRLGLARHPPGPGRRPRHRHQRLARTACRLARARGRGRPVRPHRIRRAGLPQPVGPVRPGGQRRHARACRHRQSRRLLCQGARPPGR